MDVSTLAVALGYTKKQVEQAKREGFRVQIEQDRSILETTGEEKIFYFLPKNPQKTKDGYDEFVYTNNNWEQVGVTDIDLTDYAQKTWVNDKFIENEEIFIGDDAPEGKQVLWIDEDADNIRYGAALDVTDSILSLIDQNGTLLSQVDISGRMDIDGGTVTIDYNSFTYDGTAKEPIVTSVVLDSTTLVYEEDYTISSYSATNAGSYSLKIYGINDYKGMIEVNWTITKANPTITGPSTITVDTLNETKEVAFTSNSGGYFSFSVENTSLATVSNNSGTVSITSVAKGETNLIVNVAETLNYNSKQVLIPLTILDGMCFGVIWNYGDSSPVLTRLTRENDPNHIVTHSPTIEPTACIGTTAGQSWFDDYMPWAGMVRKNYVDGQIVNFVDYSNGETYVYIPQFWSKIINNTEESKMYIYISAVQDSRLTLHPGSGKYMSRYECNSNFLSAPGTAPKVNTNLGGFRTGITAIDNKHYQYDIHTYAALELLYIVEFAHLNTQSKIGAGITSGGAALTIGETDILTYHTGRVDGTADNVSAVQYRWIENLWGNVWNWVDGILIQDGLVYICNDRANYASSITNDYESTGLYTPTNSNWHKTDQDYNNCYLIPLTTGSSDSTYTCDYYYYGSGLRGLHVGGSYGSGSNAGLFSWFGYYAPGVTFAYVGGRAVLVDNE